MIETRLSLPDQLSQMMTLEYRARQAGQRRILFREELELLGPWLNEFYETCRQEVVNLLGRDVGPMDPIERSMSYHILEWASGVPMSDPAPVAMRLFLETVPQASIAFSGVEVVARRGIAVIYEDTEIFTFTTDGPVRFLLMGWQ